MNAATDQFRLVESPFPVPCAMEGYRNTQIDWLVTDHAENSLPECSAQKNPDARFPPVLEFVKNRLELPFFLKPVEGDNIRDETVGAEPVSGGRNERVVRSEHRN